MRSQSVVEAPQPIVQVDDEVEVDAGPGPGVPGAALDTLTVPGHDEFGI